MGPISINIDVLLYAGYRSYLTCSCKQMSLVLLVELTEYLVGTSIRLHRDIPEKFKLSTHCTGFQKYLITKGLGLVRSRVDGSATLLWLAESV